MKNLLEIIENSKSDAFVEGMHYGRYLTSCRISKPSRLSILRFYFTDVHHWVLWFVPWMIIVVYREFYQTTWRAFYTDFRFRQFPLRDSLEAKPDFEHRIEITDIPAYNSPRVLPIYYWCRANLDSDDWCVYRRDIWFRHQEDSMLARIAQPPPPPLSSPGVWLA